jgi:putative ATP-dependent endonuclease of OLD family
MKFTEESRMILHDNELSDLERYVKLTRGEILFSRAWILCEGQSEFMLLRYFAELLGKPLDRLGISIIDFQNNGSPGAFVGLARNFEIPWIMFCDNDLEGKKFISQIKQHFMFNEDIGDFVRPLPEEGISLEKFLVKNGFFEEYKEILSENARRLKEHETEFVIAQDVQDIDNIKDKNIRKIILTEDNNYEIRIYKKEKSPEIIRKTDADFQSLFTDIMVYELQKDKVRHIQSLILKLREKGKGVECIPDFFVKIINDIVARIQ